MQSALMNISIVCQSLKFVEAKFIYGMIIQIRINIDRVIYNHRIDIFMLSELFILINHSEIRLFRSFNVRHDFKDEYICYCHSVAAFLMYSWVLKCVFCTAIGRCYWLFRW